MNTEIPQTPRPATAQATPQEKPAGGLPDSLSDTSGFNPALFAANMAKLAIHGQYLIGDYLKRNAEKKSHEPTHPDPLAMRQAFFDLLGALSRQPRHFFDAQWSLWRDHLNLLNVTANRLLGKEVAPVIAPSRSDKRFRHEAWQNRLVFDVIKQSYLITARWMGDLVRSVDGLDRHEKQKAEFYIRQFADALSPSNFPLTNPQVLDETLRTNGENLLRGLENLLKDLEKGQGKLDITQTDMNAFEIGGNLATTPGKVIFRNDVLELIQYEPTTAQVYRSPLLIFPPWINKFYILDMRPDNSFVAWAVAQGYTVFITSWVNPDARLASKTFEDYMQEGILAAMAAVEEATGERELNVLGYCVGGTLLAATLSYLAAKKDSRIKAATFLTTQVDFSESGELSVFVDESQLKSIDERMTLEGGILPGRNMATTFNMLRANDLIWSYVVNNYLLGRDPAPFDLLYWNSDATRLPRAVHLFYLRECYQENALAKGEMILSGTKLHLGDVTLPIYLQASQDDHIAPAKSVYKATQFFKGPIRFMLAGSGHIAGVINPPHANKYFYSIREGDAPYPADVEAWRQTATEHLGSWWPDWNNWLSQHGGDKVPARKPGDGKLSAIEDAPGSYVKVRS